MSDCGWEQTPCPMGLAGAGRVQVSFHLWPWGQGRFGGSCRGQQINYHSHAQQKSLFSQEPSPGSTGTPETCPGYSYPQRLGAEVWPVGQGWGCLGHSTNPERQCLALGGPQMSFSIQNMGHPFRSRYCVSSRICGGGLAGGGGKVVNSSGKGGAGGNDGPLGALGAA